MSFQDFMSQKWNIERSFYERSKMGYDETTKKDIPYPYPSNSEEESHKKWLEQVQDPITKEFYKGREVTVEYDDNGNEIPGSRKTVEKLPWYEISYIIRLRRKDKKEYLVTAGLLHGYNNFGNPITTSYRAPEEWFQTTFKTETRFVQKKNRHEDVTIGPNGGIMHYKVPFIPENVDKLVPYLRYNANFYVKDEGEPVEKQCVPITAEGLSALEVFKTKEFDYIKHDMFLSEKEKEERRLRYEALQQQTPQQRRAKIQQST